MARQVIWSSRSLELLAEILEYWIDRNGSVVYSEKLYSLFQIALKQLAKYPETAGLTENSRIRYKRIKSYYIYFTINETFINVVALSHVKRNPEYLDSLIESP